MAKRWYLYRSKQQEGPLTWAELSLKAQSGAVEPAHLVWASGMTEWLRADQVPGLLPVGAQTSADGGPHPLSPSGSEPVKIGLIILVTIVLILTGTLGTIAVYYLIMH